MNTDDELLVEATDGVGQLTLNRPRAINALTLGMIEGIAGALEDWRADGSVVRVELRGAGERGLCAGADVRALRQAIVDGEDPTRFLHTEYALNRVIAQYPKPYVAHQRGVTMGGGLGVSAHGSRRIAYPDTRFAMPETNIGITPDVGILGYLAQAPGELGTHLALTGATINATDGVLVGLADEVVGEAPEGTLEGQQEWIDTCYAGDDPVAIVTALENHAAPEARAAAEELRRRSPLAIAVALEAIRRARGMAGVVEVLAQDAVIVPKLCAAPDFAEGVRALLIDKDRTPHWQHARIEDVTRDEVLAVFA